MLSTKLVVPTKLRPLQVDHIQPSRSSSTNQNMEPAKTYTFDIPRNPVKRPEHPVFLETSHDNVISLTKVEPTDTLTAVVISSQKEYDTIAITKDAATKVVTAQSTELKGKNETTVKELPNVVTTVDSSITKTTLLENNNRRDETMITMTKDIAGNTIRKTVNGSTTKMHMKPKEVSFSSVIPITLLMTVKWTKVRQEFQS